MSVIINGTDGINTPNTFAFKNRIIDGGFIINQRGYVTNTALSSGAYAHDRWKAGSSGCTYTFTQGSLGVNTTITITAGTLVQVIEGCNLAEGGTYVLSWTGTAQGRLNGGTYGSSGSVVITGWTAGTNLNVEFNTGTLGSVQLETGNQATSFDYRPYGTELQLCQRYYIRYGGSGYAKHGIGVNTSTVLGYTSIFFPVNMRTSPAFNSSGGFNNALPGTITNLAIDAIGTTALSGGISVTQTGATANQPLILQSSNSATAYTEWSAEL